MSAPLPQPAHAHSSHPVPGPGATRPLVVALVITATFLVVELIGGWLTGSLALLADAGHMATDVAALALALGARWLAGRPATAARSFGFRRAEILAALLNAVALIVVAVLILWEAIRRLSDPPVVASGTMLVVALLGLVANAAAFWILVRGDRQAHARDLNVRGALLHVLGDLLGSVGAIAAALIMLATNWYAADPLLSAGVGLLILRAAWRLLGESLEVLLESTPRGTDAATVRAAMAAVNGVAGVHDLHIWLVHSGLIALSGHVELTTAEVRPWSTILLDLATLLRERFGIHHITLQPEDPRSLPAPFLGCSLDSPAGILACQSGVPPSDAHHESRSNP